MPNLDATLRPEVLFVDVAKIGGRDRLVTYESGRLNWFDPESATERALVAVTSNYKAPRIGEILHVDVTRDVNDPGLTFRVAAVRPSPRPGYGSVPPGRYPRA